LRYEEEPKPKEAGPKSKTDGDVSKKLVGKKRSFTERSKSPARGAAGGKK